MTVAELITILKKVENDQKEIIIGSYIDEAPAIKDVEERGGHVAIIPGTMDYGYAWQYVRVWWEDVFQQKKNQAVESKLEFDEIKGDKNDH